MPRKRRKYTNSLLNDSLLVGVIIIALFLILLPWVWKAVIILSAAIAIGTYLVIHYSNLQKIRRLGLDAIDNMKGSAFEERLWILFKDLGYTVEATPISGDWGADLILTKEGIRTVVQAKRYSKPVSLTAVQEAVTARVKYNCTRSMVVTNNTFTKQARELAHLNGTELWDRDKLVKELQRTISK